jgi:hypothetical protein
MKLPTRPQAPTAHFWAVNYARKLGSPNVPKSEWSMTVRSPTMLGALQKASRKLKKEQGTWYLHSVWWVTPKTQMGYEPERDRQEG